MPNLLSQLEESRKEMYEKHHVEIPEVVVCVTPKSCVFECDRRRAKSNPTPKPKNDDSEMSEFVFHIHQICMDTFPNISPADLTRLMYLSTYLNYNNELEDERGKVMHKNDIKKIMRLSDQQFYNFWNTMTSCNILHEEAYGVKLSNDLFFKGSLSSKKAVKYKKKNLAVSRMYIDGIRDLYQKSTPSSHKTLSYIFRILPFVNRKYNVVCKNPWEINVHNIDTMTVGEFADIIGYDRHNISRLITDLVHTTFMVGDKELGAIGIVSVNKSAKEDRKIYINPYVYFAGDDIKDVEVLCVFSND